MKRSSFIFVALTSSTLTFGQEPQLPVMSLNFCDPAFNQTLPATYKNVSWNKTRSAYEPVANLAAWPRGYRVFGPWADLDFKGGSKIVSAGDPRPLTRTIDCDSIAPAYPVVGPRGLSGSFVSIRFPLQAADTVYKHDFLSLVEMEGFNAGAEKRLVTAKVNFNYRPDQVRLPFPPNYVPEFALIIETKQADGAWKKIAEKKDRCLFPRDFESQPSIQIEVSADVLPQEKVRFRFGPVDLDVPAYREEMMDGQMRKFYWTPLVWLFDARFENVNCPSDFLNPAKCVDEWAP